MRSCIFMLFIIRGLRNTCNADRRSRSEGDVSDKCLLEIRSVDVTAVNLLSGKIIKHPVSIGRRHECDPSSRFGFRRCSLGLTSNFKSDRPALVLRRYSLCENRSSHSHCKCRLEK